MGIYFGKKTSSSKEEKAGVFLGVDAISKIRSWTGARVEEHTFPVGILLIIETSDKHHYRLWGVRNVIVQEDMVRIEARACTLNIYPSGRITIDVHG